MSGLLAGCLCGVCGQSVIFHAIGRPLDRDRVRCPPCAAAYAIGFALEAVLVAGQLSRVIEPGSELEWERECRAAIARLMRVSDLLVPPEKP